MLYLDFTSAFETCRKDSRNLPKRQGKPMGKQSKNRVYEKKNRIYQNRSEPKALYTIGDYMYDMPHILQPMFQLWINTLFNVVGNR